MSDPFATALSVLLRAAGAVQATYLPLGGGSYTVQALRTRHSEETHHTFGATMRDCNSMTFAVADIPELVTGDAIQIGAETLHVLAAPVLDAEGLSWVVQAAPDPA
jgi:hypothetical protein